MSKILVVTYSHTGSSRRLARTLSGAEKWTLAEIRDVRPRPAGALGGLRCVLDSLLRRRPPIHYNGPDPSRFDAVVLVSPIWASRLAGPMRSFVALHRGSLRKVAVVSVMGDSGAPNAVSEIAELLGRPPLADIAFKTKELDAADLAQRLQAFGRTVENGASDAPGMHPSLAIHAA